MYSETPKIMDRGLGRILHTVSYGLHRSGLLSLDIVHPKDSKYIPFRWLHVPINEAVHQPNDMPWLEFESPTEPVGIKPKNFAVIADLSVDAKTVKRHERENCYDAVAYKLGSTMMVGFNPKDPRSFDPSIDTIGRFHVGMAVGEQPLQAAIGVINFGRKPGFVPLHDELSAGAVVLRAEYQYNHV